MQAKKQLLELDMEQQTGSKLGKEYIKVIYCHPAYLTDEAQAGIKIAGKNINNLRYADDTTLMIESEEELRSLLMKVKEESEKDWMVGWHHQLTGHEFAHMGRQ